MKTTERSRPFEVVTDSDRAEFDHPMLWLRSPVHEGDFGVESEPWAAEVVLGFKAIGDGTLCLFVLCLLCVCSCFVLCLCFFGCFSFVRFCLCFVYVYLFCVCVCFGFVFFGLSFCAMFVEGCWSARS